MLDDFQINIEPCSLDCLRRSKKATSIEFIPHLPIAFLAARLSPLLSILINVVAGMHITVCYFACKGYSHNLKDILSLEDRLTLHNATLFAEKYLIS